MESNKNIMEQIEFIKKGLDNLQIELEKTTVQGEDKNNHITVIVNGLGNIMDYSLNMDDDKQIDKKVLEKALTEATNNGLKKAKQLETSKKQEIIGNINVPNIPGLF